MPKKQTSLIEVPRPSYPYSKITLRRIPVEERIEALVSDGMWATFPKWQKLARCSEEELQNWIDKKMAEGRLIQSPTGAKSYRYPHHEVERWHRENGLQVGEQVFDFIFPARVWEGKTEVEGFEEAPLREIDIVTFSSSKAVAQEISEALQGIGPVREASPGVYKIYCLSADLVKGIVQEIFTRIKNTPERASEVDKFYARACSVRRELVDFSAEFCHNLLNFYKTFARSLAKKGLETIKIYIPEYEDQNTQFLIWVIEAIEKFDESASVPFSGYLNTVLTHWPYDLPYAFLGKDLSNFQKEKNRAIQRLREKTGRLDPEDYFSAKEIASELGMRFSDYTDLEEKNQVWIKARSASTLEWDESGEEKSGTAIHGGVAHVGKSQKDLATAHKLSLAIVRAALDTTSFKDALGIISQVGAAELNMNLISSAGDKFIGALGNAYGMDV